MGYRDFSRSSACRAAGILALVCAIPPLSEAQDVEQCKNSYRTIQKSDVQVHDVEFALEREQDRALVEGARSVINRLDATYQDLRRGVSPAYLQDVEERKKFANDVEWNPRWANDREAFLRAMIQHQRQLANKFQADADAVSSRIKNDPGVTGFGELDSRLRAAKVAKAEAEKSFDSLGCDKEAVAAAVAQENQQNDANDAFLKQLAAFEQKVQQTQPPASEMNGRIQSYMSIARRQLVEATDAAAGASEQLNTLQQSLRSLSAASRKCAGAAERRREIEAHAQSAAQKEQLLISLLNQASEIKCSELNAAASIREKYNRSIQLLGQIGVDWKQADAANQQIETFLQASQGPERERLLHQAQNYGTEIDTDAQKARKAVGGIDLAKRNANNFLLGAQTTYALLNIPYTDLYITYSHLYPPDVSGPVQANVSAESDDGQRPGADGSGCGF